MLTTRVIPCLDVRGGRVVKGVNFVNIADAGDPVEAASSYNDEGADEIVFLDINASADGRETIIDVVARTAERVFIPLTVGGGIHDMGVMRRVLLSGADKISVNSPAVREPELISRMAMRFGTQCVTVAIDARRRSGGDGWDVFVNGGRVNTGMDAVEWAYRAYRLGAGEILLTSMDRDGTRDGFDLPLTAAVAAEVRIPVVASGGAGALPHFVEAAKSGAHGLLAASLFHYGALKIREVKEYLKNEGIPVRL
ncbi:MAG: imidazole glycerol phosphate synthase subunit HisF [Clostridiales bacterium]|jgi:cyclase|nr:imidazole glycerol phosphate synthase subunit HisF [Clostridiales bacterium]